MRLPFVVADTGFSVAAKFRGLSDAAALAAQLEEIHAENPVVAYYIEEWATHGSLAIASFEERRDAQLLGIMVYQLLKSQLDANNLNNLMGV